MSLNCPTCGNSTLEIIDVSTEGEMDMIYFANQSGQHGHNRTYFYTDYVCSNNHKFQIMKFERCAIEDCIYGTAVLGQKLIE